MVNKADRINSTEVINWLQTRALAARSNKLLNAKIKQHGGVAILKSGKRINTYATVANMNNVSIKGKMAQVIQITEGVKQTRDAYSNHELARMEFQEILEAQAIEAIKPQGHAEIIRTVDDVISDVDRLVKKYSV